MSQGPTVRGAIMAGLLEWLQRRGDLEAVVAQLPESLHPHYEVRAIVSTSRVPARALDELGDEMIRRFGLELFQQSVAQIAEADLGRTMTFLMKLGSPGFVAKRFPRIWRHYFSHGTYEIVSLGKDGEEGGEDAGGDISSNDTEEEE